MTMRLTYQQLFWTLANPFSSSAAHKPAVIEEELEEFEIATAECLAKEEIVP